MKQETDRRGTKKQQGQGQGALAAEVEEAEVQARARLGKSRAIKRLLEAHSRLR